MRNSLITVLLAFSPLSLMSADDRVVTTFAESTEGTHGRGNVYAPDIVKHRGTWLMLFGGQGKRGHDRIHLAISSDGRQWKQQGVVFAPKGVNHVNDPSVVIYRGRLYMFYTLAVAGVTDCIGLATSGDGRTWTDQGAVFLPTDKPGWDSLLVGRPSVIHDGKRFRMWYDGRKDLPLGAADPDAPKSARSRRFVGYATSADGKTWARRAKPVFGEDSGGVHVARIADRWIMVIEARVGTKWASSRDGIKWTSRGVLHAKEASRGSAYGHVTPFLLATGDSFRLYYGAAASASWDQNSICSVDLKGAELKARASLEADKDRP